MPAFRADHIGSLLRPKALRETLTVGVHVRRGNYKLKLCVDAARAIWGQA